MYRMSMGHPTEVGLKMGRPAILAVGNVFISSFASLFINFPLSPLFLSFISCTSSSISLLTLSGDDNTSGR